MKFFLHITRTSIICIFGGLLFASVTNGDSEDDSCTWNPDGSQDCTDEKIDHNVWKDPKSEDSDSASQEDRVNKLEFHIFMQFFGFLDKHDAPAVESSKYSPETVVSAVLNVFSVFDGNDDGHLEFGEVETILKDIAADDLPIIEGIFEAFSNEQLSIFEYFKLYQKMSLNWKDGKDTVITELLDPFRKLEYLPPAAAKKIIQGSAQMFIDSDEDQDNRLAQDEFANGMVRAQEKRGEKGKVELPQEQVSGLFTLMDTDKDGYLTYLEFQATLPERPKSPSETIEEVFRASDLNVDGTISEEEFGSYMRGKAEQMNAPVPSDEQITDAFEKLDENDDGSLSPAEMRGMLQGIKAAQEKRMIEAFASFDKDRDGFLSMEELEHIVKGIAASSGQKIDVNLFLTMLDQDKDGLVSLEEMQDTLEKVMPPK